jgi:hypothetical protein
LHARPTTVVALVSALSLLLVVVAMIAAGVFWDAVALVSALLGLFLVVNLYNALSRRAFSLWRRRGRPRRPARARAGHRAAPADGGVPRMGGTPGSASR